MKKILRLTVLLALIAALVEGALAFANDITTPVIAVNELATEEEALKEIYLDVNGDVFVKVKDNASRTIGKIFEMGGKGYIFKMKVAEYRDGTNYLVALNRGGNVYDYVVIPNGGTQRLGSKVMEKPFREPLKGKDAVDEEILDDTITGTAVFSKPVTEGIRGATRYQTENLK